MKNILTGEGGKKKRRSGSGWRGLTQVTNIHVSMCQAAVAHTHSHTHTLTLLYGAFF